MAWTHGGDVDDVLLIRRRGRGEEYVQRAARD
jgi:hypothetical protein